MYFHPWAIFCLFLFVWCTFYFFPRCCPSVALNLTCWLFPGSPCSLPALRTQKRERDTAFVHGAHHACIRVLGFSRIAPTCCAVNDAFVASSTHRGRNALNMSLTCSLCVFDFSGLCLFALWLGISGLKWPSADLLLPPEYKQCVSHSGGCFIIRQEKRRRAPPTWCVHTFLGALQRAVFLLADVHEVAELQTCTVFFLHCRQKRRKERIDVRNFNF